MNLIFRMVAIVGALLGLVSICALMFVSTYYTPTNVGVVVIALSSAGALLSGWGLFVLAPRTDGTGAIAVALVSVTMLVFALAITAAASTGFLLGH